MRFCLQNSVYNIVLELDLSLMRKPTALVRLVFIGRTVVL